VIPEVLSDDEKAVIRQINDIVKETIASVNNRHLINFINNCISEIYNEEFLNEYSAYNVSDATLDLIIQFQCGIKENAFEFISYFCGDSAADMVADLATCPAYYTEQSAERYQKNAGVPGAPLVFDSFVRNEEGTFIRYRELNSTFKSCLMDYLRGTISLDEAFARFEEQRIPILKGK
jgi:3-hydroxyacyl-CoA dehydrogenase